MDENASLYVMLLLVLLLNFCLIYFLYKLRQKNLTLSGENNKYKKKLLHHSQIANEINTELIYQNILLSCQEIVINQPNFINICPQIIELISHSITMDLIYYLSLDEEDRICVFFLEKGWVNFPVNSDVKNQVVMVVNQLINQVENEDKWTFDDSLEVINNLGIDRNDLKTGMNWLVDYKEIKESKIIIGFYSCDKYKFNSVVIRFLQKLIKLLIKSQEKTTQIEKLNFLERAINFSKNGIILIDSTPQHSILYINDSFEKITGYQKTDILNQNYLSLHHKSLPITEIDKIKSAIAHELSCKIITENYRKNGEKFWDEIYISPVYDENGKLTNFLEIHNDVTFQYLTEKKLIEKTTELETLNKHLNLVNQVTYHQNNGLKDILEYYIQGIAQTFNLDIVIITEKLGETHTITANYNNLSSDIFYLHDHYLVNYFSNQVTSRKTYIDSNNHPHIIQLSQYKLPNPKITYYLGIPIWIENDIYGVAHLLNIKKKENNFNFTPSLITSIAQNISRFLITQEIELEKEQMTIALKESQDRLGDILSSLEDIVWSIHPETLQLIYINQAAEKLFQVPLSKLFQKRLYWLDLVIPENRRKVKESYGDLFNISLLGKQKKYHDLEYYIRLENGDVKCIRDRAMIICNDDGSQQRVEGIITDITHYQQTQKALEKSEQELRHIFALAPIGMIITNLQGVIIEVNNSFSELIKYNNKDIVNQLQTKFCHPDDKSKYSLIKQKIIIDNLDEYSQEIRLLSSNGSVIHTIVNITALRDKRGTIIKFIEQIVNISEIKIMEEQMLYDSFYDKLTGLPNRFLLVDRLKQFLAISQEKSSYISAILVIDVDKFKKVNDRFGHKIGNNVLVLIAEKIIRCVKTTDTVARISSDEFIVFLPNLNSENEVKEIVEKIISACFFKTNIDEQEIISSVSIGVTLSSFGYGKADDMIRDADIAMYQAKQKGGNCYQIFSPSMHQELLKKLSLESSLIKALENQELVLFYQPIINLKTGIIAGFEALIRWNSPIHGFISPSDFIPIAEESGLIVELGNWILLTAAKQANEWAKLYPEMNLSIAVNVSSKQLLDNNFINKIDAVLESTKVKPNLLKIEITESILMKNYEYGKGILQQIQSRNLKISLDDFGTGYSSLSYLNMLPFNTLKIDRTFIQPLINPDSPTPIVEAIVNLAHHLSLEVVAEGIETKIQEKILQNIECNYGQGYFYSPPVNAKDANNLIQLFSQRKGNSE